MEQNQIKNIAIAVLAVAVVALGYLQMGGSLSGKTLTPQKAADTTLAFINTNMLQGGAKATIVGDVKSEKGIYKFDISVNGQNFSTYVTKDGTLFFPQGIEIPVSTSTPSANNASTTNPAPQANSQQTCDTMAKASQANLEAFIVSNCPYGLQMQRILAEVAKGIPELQKNLKIKYIGSVENGKITSMHGDQEAQENLKQICIREEQPAKFFDYLSCYMQEGKTDQCLTQTQIDKTKLNSCVTNPKKGLAFAQKDFTDANKYQVSGSPTLFLNGQKASEFDFGGRTAQAVKTLVCCGFNETQAFCSKNLPTDQASVGFSIQTTGGGSAGNCNTTQ